MISEFDEGQRLSQLLFLYQGIYIMNDVILLREKEI